MLNTKEEVLAALVHGDDASIVGLAESVWFEAKGEPYRLDDAKSKWELAKDVSAMANAEGGVILIAAQTDQAQGVRQETVREVRAVPRSMVDEQRIRDVLRGLLFPSLGNGLRIVDFPRCEEGQVVVAIVIEPSAARDRPVMIRTRAEVRVGESVHKPEVWAIATRVGSATEWMAGERVWADLQQAKTGGPPTPAGEAGREASPESRLAEERANLVASLELDDVAYWSLAAYPLRPVSLEGFYARDGVKGVLQSMEGSLTIPHGFGLGYGSTLAPIGSDLALLLPGVSGLRVDPDGLVVAIAAGTPEMLGWAESKYALPTPENGARPLPVNRYALATWALDFALLVRNHLVEQGHENEWTYVSSAERLTSGARPLHLFLHDNLLRSGDPAAVDSGSRHLRLGDSAESDAYELVASFIHWFGRRGTDLDLATDGRITAEGLRRDR